MISRLLSLMVLLGWLSIAQQSIAATCADSFVNPLTEISWQCAFPMSIGGVVEVGTGDNNDLDDDSGITDPICACNNGGIPTVGMKTSFWEPTIMIDTVHDAWCLNAMGVQLDNPSPGSGDGSYTASIGGQKNEMFQQIHYYKFPVWAILDMFTDIPCTDSGGFDIAILSELLPHWNDPILSMLLHPEALVFGNPAAYLACMADSIAAANGKPMDQLFWCMGSWGNAYPFTGSIGASNVTSANAGLAARALYMQSRTGILWDAGIDSCGSVYTPIWNKSHYRFQLMRPVQDNSCLPIGMAGIGWTSGKDLIIGGGNYTWMVFRKVKCCVGY